MTRNSLVGVPVLLLALALSLTSSTPLRAQTGLAKLGVSHANGEKGRATAINVGPHPSSPGWWVFLTCNHCFENSGGGSDAYLWIRGEWVKATQVTRAPEQDLMVLTAPSNHKLNYVTPAYGYTGDAVAVGYAGGSYAAFEGRITSLNPHIVELPKPYRSQYDGLSGGAAFAPRTDGMAGIVWGAKNEIVTITKVCDCAKVLDFSHCLPTHWRTERRRCGGRRQPVPGAPYARDCPDPTRPPYVPPQQPQTPPQTPGRANFVTVDEFRAAVQQILVMVEGIEGRQGERGETGQRGEQGLPGRGIDNVWLIDNSLWVRYSDAQEICVGEVQIPAAQVDIEAIVQQVDIEAIVQRVLARVDVPEVDEASIVARVLENVKVPTPKDGPPGTVNVIITDNGEEVGRYNTLRSGSTVVVDVTRFKKEPEEE